MSKRINKLAIAALAGVMTVGAFSAYASEDSSGKHECKAGGNCKTVAGEAKAGESSKAAEGEQEHKHDHEHEHKDSE